MYRVKEALKKYLIALSVASILNIDCLIRIGKGEFEGNFISVYLNSFTGGIRTMENGEHVLVLYLFDLAYLLILSIIFGTDLYKEIYGTGIYVMTRIKSRSKWMLRKVGKLLGECIISAIIYCSCVLLLQLYHTRVICDKNAILAYFITVIFVAYNIFLVALIINAVSIMGKISYGVCAGTASLVIMVIYVIKYDEISMFAGNLKYMYLAPVNMINLFYETDLKFVLLVFAYYTLIVGLIVFGLLKYIKRMDIKLLESDL